MLDSLLLKKAKELKETPVLKIEKPISANQFFYLYLVIFAVIFIFFVVSFKFQVLNHENFLSLSLSNRERVILEIPLRGIIYDQHKKPLVENKIAFDLLLDIRDLPLDEKERKNSLLLASNLLKKDFSFLDNLIKDSDSSQIKLKENLDYETYLLFQSNLEKLPGFFIQKRVLRNYLEPDFSHVLGYLNKISKKELKNLTDYTIFDYIGREGVESAFERYLRGKPGKIKIIRDVLGKSVDIKKIEEAVAGYNIVLWLNSDLQKKLTQVLKKNLQRVGAQRAAALAINPKNGAVLAMVSLPDFDNNLFFKSESEKELEKLFKNPLKPLFNRVIAGEYAVGSTIKPLIAAAALEENIIDPTKKILAEGEIKVVSPYNPNIVYTFRDWRVHGWTDLKKAIAQSVNIYFYAIGGGYQNQTGLGVERIKKYLSLFGWGQKTGIELPGEKAGFLPDSDWKKRELKEEWFVGNTYHLSIGQGYLRATPLQVAMAISAIANGGTLFKPRILKEVLDEKGNIVFESKPEIIRKGFIKEENLNWVREGMRDGVRYGSSVILADLPVEAASKTGTAQTGREGYYHHWVSVFAPYKDPEIVITILIEDVRGLQSATLPVAKEILEWYFEK